MDSACHGRFSKIQNPDPENHSLHAGVYGHTELMPEARLLKARQPTPQYQTEIKKRASALLCFH